MFVQPIYFPPQARFISQHCAYRDWECKDSRLVEPPPPPLGRGGFCDIVVLDLMGSVGRLGCGVFVCGCVRCECALKSEGLLSICATVSECASGGVKMKSLLMI